jgi:hypothetical protein
MNAKTKRQVGVGLCVLLIAVAAGAGFDHWRATRQPAEFAPLPQFGSLIPALEDVEIKGEGDVRFLLLGRGRKVVQRRFEDEGRTRSSISLAEREGERDRKDHGHEEGLPMEDFCASSNRCTQRPMLPE